LPEQQKIADCLTSVNELISAHGQKLDALKTHKTGLMQQLFPREGETLPHLRFPEFQDTPEWKERTLEFACQMQAGKFVSASDIQDESGEDLYPCYGGNGLRGYTRTFTHSGKYPLIGRQSGALCWKRSAMKSDSFRKSGRCWPRASAKAARNHLKNWSWPSGKSDVHGERSVVAT
jgi:type I restriction enzyme S subunit